MAETNPAEKELDPKALKKAEKARKKEEKALKKKEKMENLEQEEESRGGKVIIVLVSLAMIIIWLAIFALLIKWDVGGFGSSVLYPVLKDVPYVNKILPEVEDPNAGDPNASLTMKEALAKIKELEKEIESQKEASGSSNDTISSLEKEIARLQVYEKQQQDFEKTKRKFYEEVVFGDKAPDIKDYKEYYEAIDPQNAELLYKQVISQMKEDEDVSDYVKAYSEMKPKAAAAIMEQMTDDLELVAKILSNMSATSRGDILAAMNADVAASVTKLMEP